MIFVDCTEGLSGDMLLSAMLQLLPGGRKTEIISRMTEVAKGGGLDLTVVNIHESGDAGLGISYGPTAMDREETPYEEAFSMLDRFSRSLESSSDLPRKILGHIFDAESEAHGLPAPKVHLHEIGRPQAILNMAAIGLVHSELVALGAGEFVSSTIVTGKGIVVVSHGAVRVPAPAARILLRGLDHTLGTDPGERATPSGIASVKAMISRQSDDIPETFRAKGIGFGTKRFGGRLGRTTVQWV
jgi:uncharacterized protein (DUF111 family)